VNILTLYVNTMSPRSENDTSANATQLNHSISGHPGTVSVKYLWNDVQSINTRAKQRCTHTCTLVYTLNDPVLECKSNKWYLCWGRSLLYGSRQEWPLQSCLTYHTDSKRNTKHILVKIFLIDDYLALQTKSNWNSLLLFCLIIHVQYNTLSLFPPFPRKLS